MKTNQFGYYKEVTEKYTRHIYNGKLHRLDDAAVVYTNGTKYWYKEGKRHRLDGPAIIRANGTEEYFINGKKLAKKDFDLVIQ